MPIPTRLMDDHSEAYLEWKQAGLRGLTCIHVDAHLDVSDTGLGARELSEMASCRSASELERFRSSEFLPWGGLHCGNYLYPSLYEGIVDHLVWVVPPHLVRGDSLLGWTRGELQNWMNLTAGEFRSLRESQGRVEGSVKGRHFTLCTADRLPELPADGVLVDIDIDYFLDPDDHVWQTPWELKQRLGSVSVRALTVARSVNGGYTPLEHRYLGDVTLAVFRDGAEEQRALVERLLRADRARVEDPDVYSREEWPEGPGWLAPTLCIKRAAAGKEEPGSENHALAARLDPDYRLHALNVGAALFRKKRYQEANRWLERSEQEMALCTYLRGLARFKQEDHLGATALWRPLLSSGGLRPLERSYVSFMLAKSLSVLKRTAESLPLFEAALRHEPDHPDYHHHYGLALRDAGELTRAAQALRRSIRLAPDRLASLQVHLDLADVYAAESKAALAQAERRQVRRKDVTGLYALKAMLSEGSR
ncbi:MAG: tetratricopeptide repeat protein [Armatimonadetes bacterium]|nr:tetratricopeptide repeat protein [Armatimonadota bacterium]